MLVQRLGQPDEQCLFSTWVEDSFAMLRKDGDGTVAAITVSLEDVHAACTRWAFRIDAPAAEDRRALWGGFTGTLDWHPGAGGLGVAQSAIRMCRWIGVGPFE
jgi:hypothetical protein